MDKLTRKKSPCNHIDFVVAEDGIDIAPATASIRQLKGIVPKPATPVGIEDMEAAIAEGASAA
jgi:hypothetical protein